MNKKIKKTYEWMFILSSHRQWTIHKMLLNNKMEQAVGTNNVAESQKHQGEWKR